MAKIQNPHQVITGITNANYTNAANAVKCDHVSAVTVMGVVTVAGSPSSCRLESTIDPHELIDAGTATWVAESVTNSANFVQTNVGPITGVRLNVAASGGTWTLNVRQVYDASKNN